ncbi:MAG TPA: glycine cleavage system protein GcvH [Gammaproteobacteria bacterium]|jgi:glycine cleavage system H protein|nr:glycine cleavage system protein GcvH [Gammaproteobacteria bacterium]
MSHIPKNVKYTRTHEWVQEDDDVITLGITDHAQTMIGDLVYVELPEVDTHLSSGEECAIIESDKTAADIYIPVSGEVIEINESVIQNPNLINQDPYGRGWLLRLRIHGKVGELLTPKEYIKVIASEAH